MSTPLNAPSLDSSPLLRQSSILLHSLFHLLLRLYQTPLSMRQPSGTCKFSCLTPKNTSLMSSISSSQSSPLSSVSSEFSFLDSSPVYPCILPTPVTYTLYVAVITNAPVLYEIKKLPFYESDAISQELVRLLHDALWLQSYYPLSTSEPDQALLLITGELVQCTLNTLHLHGFHSYITHLPPKVLLLVFKPIFLSLSPYEQERYQEIITSEPCEPVTEVTLQPLPVRAPSSWPSHSMASPITPSLASRISSRPTSPTETLVPESGFSQENALLRSAAMHVTPEGRQLISSPTQTLPRVFLKPPTTPNTQCFLCHNKGHYRENCLSYQCPHCHEVAPGHPSHLCLRTQCTFCQHWGHSDRVCPQRVCGDCDQPGHVADDCLFSNLTQEQAAHIFGDGTPL